MVYKLCICLINGIVMFAMKGPTYKYRSGILFLQNFIVCMASLFVYFRIPVFRMIFFQCVMIFCVLFSPMSDTVDIKSIQVFIESDCTEGCDYLTQGSFFFAVHSI